jgi:ABC-type uncharacterized transport system substrate-binding protein
MRTELERCGTDVPCQILWHAASQRRAARVFGPLLAAVLLCGCKEEMPPKPRTAVAQEPAASQPAGASAAGGHLSGGRVLLVHSYHPEYPWVDTITHGVQSVIQGQGIDLRVFYMDTKRHTDEAWKIRAGERAQAEVESFRPDVVIASDDDAQEYFARAYVGGALPIVFCGVDADPTKYGYPASNVTGVIERPHFRESLELARRLRPIRRIAVLSCHDSTSIVAMGFMKQEQLDVEVVEWVLANDFDEWQAAIARLNNAVDALVIRSYQAVKVPGSVENVPPVQVAEWTIAHTTIPTIAFHDFEIQDGLLVGVVKSGMEYGRKAAECGLQILDGTSPAALPIMRAKLGIPTINRETARRLGIELTPELTSGVTLVPAD